MKWIDVKDKLKMITALAPLMWLLLIFADYFLNLNQEWWVLTVVVVVGYLVACATALLTGIFYRDSIQQAEVYEPEPTFQPKRNIPVMSHGNIVASILTHTVPIIKDIASDVREVLWYSDIPRIVDVVREGSCHPVRQLPNGKLIYDYDLAAFIRGVYSGEPLSRSHWMGRMRRPMTRTQYTGCCLLLEQHKLLAGRTKRQAGTVVGVKDVEELLMALKIVPDLQEPPGPSQYPSAYA